MKPKIIISFVALLFTAESHCVSANVRFGTSTTGYTTVDNSNDHYLRYVRYMTVPFNKQSGAVWNEGNDTTGKTTTEIQTIVNNIKALETDARQKEIFTKMKAASETFGFRDVSHAKARVQQRLQTISMMENFNTDGRYGYHTTSQPVNISATQWRKGDRVSFYFRQTSGTAYNAIVQLCSSSSRTSGECLGAIMACIWWGAASGMGATDFNSLYPGATALNMDSKKNNSWCLNVADAVDTSTYVPGDWGYWKNYNYNQVIHQNAFYKRGWLEGDTTKKIYYWSGENALYFQNNLFAGLGVPAKSATDMREELRLGYNGDLAKVITGLAPSGGTYNGLEVNTIDAGPEAEDKLKFVLVRRPRF